MRNPVSRIHIGTSGWVYPHWQGVFYPEDLPSNQQLSFYAERFSTTEINNSFYHLPSEETVRTWAATVPKGFRFAAKGSRYITHMKKLKNPSESSRRFLERMEELENTLAVVLFQLPPHWRANPERLQEFLETLPADNRYAFEFRDESWFTSQVYDALAKAGAALCLYDRGGHTSPRVRTADFAYVRLHGGTEGSTGAYGEKALTQWAHTLEELAEECKDVFCYFNNDQQGHAIHNAFRLKELLHR